MLLQLAVQATGFMLPTIPVTEPTHWVPATQPSLTSVLPIGRLQSPPDQFTGRKYRRISQTDPGLFNNLVTGRIYQPQREFTGYREICCSHHPSADSRLTGYRENLQVTERSAASTIPVLTAGSPVTGRIYRLQGDLLLPPFQC